MVCFRECAWDTGFGFDFGDDFGVLRAGVLGLGWLVVVVVGCCSGAGVICVWRLLFW